MRALRLLLLSFLGRPALGSSLDGSTESGTWIWNTDSQDICEEGARGIDTLTNMVTTTNGIIVAVGSTNSSCLRESSDRQLLAIAYDMEGTLQWRQQYNSPAGANLTPRGVAAAGGGGVLICGDVSGGAYTDDRLSYGGLDMFAVTIDLRGEMVASWQFGTEGDDICFGIVGSPTTGEVYLATHTHGDIVAGHIEGQTDVLIGVTDAYYEFVEWVLVTNSTIENVPTGIAAFETGDVAIAGYAVNVTEENDARTVAMFAQRWNKIGAPPNSEKAFLDRAWEGSLKASQTGQNKVVGVVVDANQDMLVAGQADGQPWGEAPKGYADFVLLKLDGDTGERICAWQGGTGGGDWPTSVALDIDGVSSFIAGFTDAVIETNGIGKYGSMVVHMGSDCETDATDWWFDNTGGSTDNQFTTGVTVAEGGQLLICRYMATSGLDQSYVQLGAPQPVGDLSTMELGQIAYAGTYSTDTSKHGIGRLGLELTIGFVCAAGAAIIMGVFWAVWWVRKRRRLPLLSHKTSSGSEQGVAADVYFKKPATEFSLASPLRNASVADGGDSSDLNSNENSMAIEEIDVMSEFEIDITGLLLQSKLGEGYFGTVYRGRWQGQKVAVKKLKQTVDLRSLRHEVSCLGRLRHPNVCFFYGCTKPPMCLIVSELLWGSLYKLLHKDTKQELSDRARFRIVKDIARGLAYIHMRSFVHRDVSTSNVLLTGDAAHIEEICARSTDEPLAKISDFGLSRPSDSAVTQVAGNFFYLPPEVYRGNESTDKSDVYSYALVMWETYTRKKPFAELSPQLAAFNAAEKLARPPIDDTIPTGIAFLMQDCWHPEQEERPASAEALEALEEMEAQWIGYGGAAAAAFPAASEEVTPSRMISGTFSPLRAYGKNRYAAMYGGFDDDDDGASSAGGPTEADTGGADAGAGFGSDTEAQLGRSRNGSIQSAYGPASADRPRQSMTRLGDIAFRLPPEVVRGRSSFTAWYTDMERTMSRSVMSGSDAAVAASASGHGNAHDGDTDASGSQAGGYVPFPRHT